jgi:hypothetical protein
VQGVTTALALQEGLSSPLFAVSMAFSVIVMYDAMGVRQHAGKQAAVLNQVRDTWEELSIAASASPKCAVAVVQAEVPLFSVMGLSWQAC